MLLLRGLRAVNNISNVMPVKDNIVHSQLKEASVIKEDEHFYLCLRYQYETNDGEIHDLIFPKVDLPYSNHIIPDVRISMYWCDFDSASRLIPNTDYVMRIGKAFDTEGVIINRTVGKAMTLDEISKALGYKVILKEDKINEQNG